MGLSTSKEQQGCSEPAEEVFNGTALYFDQLSPHTYLLQSLETGGRKKTTPNVCFPRPAAVIPWLHVEVCLCSGLWWHSLKRSWPHQTYSCGSAARYKFCRFQAWRFQSCAEPHGNDSQSYSYKNNYIARGKEWQEMSPKEISAVVTGSVPTL